MIEVKKGETVIVKGFTGIKLGVFEVSKADKKTVTVMKRNGDEMIFDRKTGKQINVEEGKEKYANSLMEDDGSYVAPSASKKSKKASKPATKKAKPEPEDDDEDEDEDEEEEVKPVKKAKKSAKKTKKVTEEDDDDDFEDMDD
jgi:hypothetical protein